MIMMCCCYFFFGYRFRIQVRVRPNFLSTYDIPTTTLQRAAAVIDVLADKNPTSSQEPSGRKLCRRVYILPINHWTRVVGGGVLVKMIGRKMHHHRDGSY